MGMRGVGAGRRREAAEKVAAGPKRRFPWLKKGLSRPDRVIAFLQFLPVTKGILAGEKMRLLPDQREFVREVYGPTKKGGRRLRTLAIKSEPKGNGKTGLTAGLALCHLIGPEAEPRGEIYSAAIDRQQAGIIFAEMEAIIAAIPEFEARVNISRFLKKMEVLEGPGAGSTYEALSADARRAHGLAPSLWIYDELAQAKERTLLDNLMEGRGKRKEALGIVISTQAADDEHALSQLIDDALTGKDPATYVQMHSAPLDADPYAEATWRACNPAFGVFLDVDDLRSSSERARRMPAFEPAFRNLRLNQRVDAQADSRIVTQAVWMQGSKEVSREALRGRACYGGLDLSGKHDLTALVLAFPGDEGGYDILPFFWTPAGQLDERRPAERDLFKLWIAQKHLIAIPGLTVRTPFIARQLGHIATEFRIRAIGYDRWRIDDLKADLADQGITVALEPFGQGFKDMAPAIDYFSELALDKALRHGSHPVLTASVAAAITVGDAAGNQKIEKEASNKRSSVRVDGAVALAMALGTARRHVEEKPVDISDFLANAVVA